MHLESENDISNFVVDWKGERESQVKEQRIKRVQSRANWRKKKGMV